MILFKDAETKKYEARYFDKQGYKILDMTSQRLQIQPPKKK